MSVIKSIILGIIQGLTEFIPVSSSAHLNIFPWLFEWERMPDSFDFALHTGTLLALLVFFFKDWLQLIVGGWNLAVKKETSRDGRMFWYIVAATIPAGLIGVLLEKIVDDVIIKDNLELEMILISAALIIMGVILYLTDKNSKQKITYNKLRFKPTFIVGVSQCIAAALPGISRSGITMAVARKMGVERESAAKLSFMLSAPIVGGGMLVSIVKGDFTIDASFILGILASFIVGLLVIKFLMNFLKRGTYKMFALYRIVLGIFIIGAVIVK